MYMPFKFANEVCDRFLNLLKNLKITPPIGSNLEDELLSVVRLMEMAKNPNLIHEQNDISVLRAAAGMHDLAAKILSVALIPEFQDKFVPHLRLITESKNLLASLGQNTCSKYSDDLARKIAELYIGCLAAHVGTQVELDSPSNSKGDNPDVIFVVEEIDKQPKRWTLAIKTISTQCGQTIYERIKEGVKQIESPKCNAEIGMVVVNAKNALDHDALWNTDFPDVQTAIDSLHNQLKNLIKNAEAGRCESEWDDLFSGKVVRPVIFMGHSLVRLPTEASNQTPTPIKMLTMYDAQGELDPCGSSLADCMNYFMQTILQGHPSSQGQDLPC